MHNKSCNFCTVIRFKIACVLKIKAFWTSNFSNLVAVGARIEPRGSEIHER